MTMPSPETIYRFEVHPTSNNDPRTKSLLHSAHALGLTGIEAIQLIELYFLRGKLSAEEQSSISRSLLESPLTQTVSWREAGPADAERSGGDENTAIIEVSFRPGVTDPVADYLSRAISMLDIEGINAVTSGQQYIVVGKNLNAALLKQLASRLLANDVIQHFSLGTITPGFPDSAPASGHLEFLPLAAMTKAELEALSQDRRSALNLEEMEAIQRYCQQENRPLTDVEFEMIAQTWSEHCVHKTFKSKVTISNPNQGDQRFPAQYDHLFNQTIRAATERIRHPLVLSAFRDNAGIIAFGDQFEVSFKVETHNHPSAIEPFGGANTGVGGVIRDVLGVSAKPIASTNVLCFGMEDLAMADLPQGVIHPRQIAAGVVSGIQDYGNKMGIPTVNGAVNYDAGYTANPLVFCGSVGLAPRDSHPRNVEAGDRVILLGGRTGRDGLRGATFSSMTMDAKTGEVSGASVQIGAPIVEKGVLDVILAARDERLYHAITDCGAGGLSSAVGEMGSECGVIVQLETVPLKYPGLEPWEIWLSEAQERMVLAVPPAALPALAALCEKYEVELSDIGVFNTTGRTQVSYKGRMVLDLDNDFLHHGLPQRRNEAFIRQPEYPSGWKDDNAAVAYQKNPRQVLLNLLAHPNIASKEGVIRAYDHEVQGGTVVKPLCGVHYDGPSDGSMIKPVTVPGEAALVVSAGINPEYGKVDPYEMTIHVLDEAIRNAVCSGADPDQTVILDNFCWGDPRDPQTMGDLVQSAQACYDGALRYGTPFISGKDSFNNEYLGSDGLRHAIPPTLLISALSIVPDWRLALTSDLKTAGNLLYLAGYFEPRFGGSHHNLVTPDGVIEEGLPVCDPQTPALYRQIYRANQAGLIQSAHDLSEGGLLVAAAEMALGGRLGLKLELSAADPWREAFGESGGCLLVEVKEEDQAAFEAGFNGLPLRLIGSVIRLPVLDVRSGEEHWLQADLEAMLAAWKERRIAEVAS